MDSLFQDLRYGLRLWARQPGFTAVVLITLALGIGANTAIFSLVDAVLLRPLPFEAPERLVRIWGVEAARASSEGNAGRYDYNVSPNDFVDWQRETRSFEALSVYGTGNVTLTGVGEAVKVRTAMVSAGFFTMLGIEPLAGRFFTEADGKPGQPPVVVLGESLWRRQFGADPGAIGSSITVSGSVYTVLGVAPAGLEPPIVEQRGAPELWQPLALSFPPEARGGHWLHALGRLKPGVSVAQAQAELDALNRRLEQIHPSTNTGRGALVRPLSESIVGEVRPALTLLLGAVGFVLLIAATNVANLLIARSLSRGRELAVRAALGAGRVRLIRQLLLESILIALPGGGLGLLLALWSTDLLVALSGGDIPRLERIDIDLRILIFTLVVSVGTGILFGLLPALQGSRSASRSVFPGQERAVTSSRPRRMVREALVTVEVALSIVLLIGAGLLIRSLWRLEGIDPGFSTAKVLTVELSVPRPATTTPDQAQAMTEGLIEQVRVLPGVESVGTTSILPMSGANSCDGFTIEGREVPAGQEPCAEIRASSPGYFRAMGIPLVRGRLFDGRDRADAPPVALINERMARTFFAGREPVGARINLGDPSSPSWIEVVGVVGDVRHFGLGLEPAPELYRPQLQAPAWSYTLAVRTAGEPEGMVLALREVVHGIDPEIPMHNLRTTEALVNASVAQPRFRTTLLSLFSGLALLLAGVGIFGVMTWSVAQRTREIGIRVALGARPADILRLVLRQGMGAVAAGVGLGLMGALALDRVLERLLFGVSATDPVTFMAVPGVLVVVALLACWLPVRRALRVEPGTALRCE